VRRRVLIVAFAAVLVGAPAGFAGTPLPALQRKLALALRVPHVSPARSAAIAFDLTSGTTAFTQNGSRSLAPASNEKLPVAYAALVKLGPAFRIETDVLGEGALTGSTWRGRLFLKGGGDPTLSSSSLRSLAVQVRAAGISRVTGGVLGDESWFDARRTVAGWKPAFFLNESPPLSALIVDRDRIGGVLSRSPALAATSAFVAALRKAGVAVTGRVGVGVAAEEAFPLASVLSPPLGSIVGFMDRESDNFTAELLLKQLGAVEAHRGTSAAGAAVVTRTCGAGARRRTGSASP
jgi:D-alanyl-D-alanine carboxypeptidase/D-alanyl-D-alanine-endopeptidase (penicillin-binding protein 4)